MTKEQLNDFTNLAISEVTKCDDATPERIAKAKQFVSSILFHLVEYVEEGTHQEGASYFDDEKFGNDKWDPSLRFDFTLFLVTIDENEQRMIECLAEDK